MLLPTGTGADQLAWDPQVVMAWEELPPPVSVWLKATVAPAPIWGTLEVTVAVRVTCLPALTGVGVGLAVTLVTELAT